MSAYSHHANPLVSPTSSYDRNQLWLEQHQARLAAATEQEENRQLSELQAVPKIDNLSAKLAATRASVDVSTRLFKDAEKMRETKKHLTDIAVATAVVGVPAITKYAAQLQREGNISDRLYAQAKALEDKRKAIQEAHEAEENALHKMQSPPPSARSMRSSSMENSGLNISSHSSLPGSTVHNNAPRHTVEQLYRMGDELRAKKEATIRALAEEAKLLAQPKLNPRSLEIAANMSEETLQRLYHKDIASKFPRGSKEREAAEALSPKKHTTTLIQDLPNSPRGKNSPKYIARWEEEEAELTFHPKIEKRSTKLAIKKYGGAIPVEDRLLSEAEKIATRKKEFAKSVIEHELQDCTFQPNAERRTALSPRNNGNQSTTNNGTVKSSEEVGKRIFYEQLAWLNDRENRLREAKRNQAEKELNGCTFKPNVANGRRASIGGGVSSLLSSGVSGGTKQRRSSLPGNTAAPPPGYDKFMSRLAQARKLAYEKANPPFADGSNWKPVSTRAVSPKFHGRTNDENNQQNSRGIRGRVMAAIHTRFTGNNNNNNKSLAQNDTVLPSVSQIISQAVTKMVTQAGKSISTTGSTTGSTSNKNTVPAPTEVATAEDIRARLRQLEQNMGNTTTNTSTSRLTSSNSVASSGGLATTVIAGVAPKGIIKNNSSNSLNSKINTNNSLLPPDIRFSTTTNNNNNIPGSPDPLLSRLEAMASAAALGGQR